MTSPDVNEWIATVEARLAAVELGASSLGDTVASLTAEVAVIKADQRRLITDFNTLSQRVTALETAPDPDPDPVPPVWKPAFPGDTKTGELRWGAATGGNTEPGSRYGGKEGISRTYWDMSKTAQCITRVKLDFSKGRLPWISFKVGSWATFASGSQDAAFKKLLTDLEAASVAAGGKPIWLSVHHEPEGSREFGTDESSALDKTSINNWRAVQRHVRDLITATNVKNVAFGCCMMSWSWDVNSGRRPAYWVDGMAGVWDFFGVDCYNDTKSPDTQKFADMAMWKALVAHAKSLNLRIALGEWGVRPGSQAGADIQGCYNEFVKQGLVGAAYFDSGLNSDTGSWELTAAQLTTFNSICATSPRI